MDSGRDHERLTERPVLDGLIEVSLGRLGDVDGHLARPDVARGDDPRAMERADGVDRQVDHRVEGVAVEGQKRAQLEYDALLDLVGLGLEPHAGGAVALQAAGKGMRRGRLDRERLAVDHLDPLIFDLAEPLLDLHLREDERRVIQPHRPDLLALRAAADVGEPRKDRVSPAAVDRGDELNVHRQHVFGGVGESLDDLVDLLQDLGRIVGTQLGLRGRQHGDLFAVPFADAGALEDPVDDGFLRS